ncbi:MAG: serine/threonine protein kinase [Chlamydiales bacterium]
MRRVLDVCGTSGWKKWRRVWISVLLDSTPAMSLAAGQTLSFYEILGPLDAGGMGEVYRARDTRLEREVAIKALPEELADDDERLLRFEREAKTLALLNHSNVAGIHGVDKEGGICFLALELVPGEDLEARLARGPLGVDEGSTSTGRSPRDSRRLTKRALSIATSSRPTCASLPTAS